MITITNIAVEKIKEISESENVGHYTIRLKIQGGGCAGWTYDMFYEDKISDLDEIFEQDGVKVVIDPLSFQYLDGTEINYAETSISAGFSFINPNSKGNCGCGSSFNV